MVVIKGVESECMNDCYYRVLGYSQPEATVRQLRAAYQARSALLRNALRAGVSESEQAELREAQSCIGVAHRVLQNARSRAAYNRSRNVVVDHRCSQFSRARRVIDLVDLREQIRKLQAELAEKEAELARRTEEVSDLMGRLDIKTEQLSRAEGAARERDLVIEQLRKEIEDLRARIDRLTEQLDSYSLAELEQSPVRARRAPMIAAKFVDRMANRSSTLEEEHSQEGAPSPQLAGPSVSAERLSHERDLSPPLPGPSTPPAPLHEGTASPQMPGPSTPPEPLHGGASDSRLPSPSVPPEPLHGEVSSPQIAGPSTPPEGEHLPRGASSPHVQSEEPLHGEAAVVTRPVIPLAAKKLPVRQSGGPSEPPVRRRQRFVPSEDQRTCIITGLKFRSQGPMFFVKFSPDQEGHEEKHAEDIVDAFPEESAAFLRGLRTSHPRQLSTLRRKGLRFLLNLM